MGLLAKLFNDASDKEFKLAQDLVAIAIADGEISEAERNMITQICQNEGISKETDGGLSAWLRLAWCQ